MYNFRKNGRGFTIIELIVVISIISVLATIIVTNVFVYVKKSKDSAVRAEMAQLSTFGSNYFDTNGSYANYCDAIDTQPFFVKIADFVGNLPVVCNNGVNKWKSCCIDEAHGSVSPLSWAVCTKLITDTASAWCVDYTGASRKIDINDCKSNMVVGNMATCPAGD